VLNLNRQLYFSHMELEMLQVGHVRNICPELSYELEEWGHFQVIVALFDRPSIRTLGCKNYREEWLSG